MQSELEQARSIAVDEATRADQMKHGSYFFCPLSTFANMDVPCADTLLFISQRETRTNRRGLGRCGGDADKAAGARRGSEAIVPRGGGWRSAEGASCWAGPSPHGARPLHPKPQGFLTSFSNHHSPNSFPTADLVAFNLLPGQYDPESLTLTFWISDCTASRN